jgi:hypothetical protein
MPIQIKELIIRATVDENAGQGSSPTSSPGSSGTDKEKEKERLIRECVDEVLEVLRMQNEP